MQKKGIDVRVLEIDMRSIRRVRKWGYRKDEYEGITVYRMAVPCGPIPRLLDTLSPTAGEYVFKKILKDWGKPDILHTHFSATSLAAVRLHEKYTIPLVLTEHGSGLLRHNVTERDKMLFLLTANAAEKIIAVSTALKSDLTTLTQNNIEVIPNVITQSFLGVGSEKEEKFTFISVGNLVDSKRFDLTLGAFGKLYAEHPQTQLLVIGDGVRRQDLEERAQRLGLTGSVSFLGRLPNAQLPQLYRRCHCFVLPSMFETFGVVYAEAIACGLPVIATRCGGPEDIVNEYNGVLIATDSKDELYDAMKLMVLQANNYDPQLMSDDIKSRFGEDAVVRQLISVYNQVLDSQ